MGELSGVVSAQLRRVHREVLADLGVSVAIRRGTSTLAVQTVRVVRAGAGRRVDAGSIEQSQGRVNVYGDTDLDIQTGDRLTWQSEVYEVQYVQPDRSIRTAAEVTLIQ